MYLNKDIPTGSFLKTNGEVLPRLNPADYQHLSGLLGDPVMPTSYSIALPVDDVEKMVDTVVDATKQFIIGGSGGLNIDSLAEWDCNDTQEAPKQGGTIKHHDDPKRWGNNKAHRSKSKRKVTARIARVSKKRNR